MPLKNFLQAAGIFIFCFIICNFIILNFYPDTVLFFHSLTEITCLVIALAIFILIWFTYEQCSTESHLLAFGFLAVSLFQFMHIIAFAPAQDYSIWYMLLSRIIEIGIIFLIILNKESSLIISKKAGLLITVTLSLAIWLIVWSNRGSLPVMYTGRDFFSLRNIIELGIAFFILASFFFLVSKPPAKSYKYEYLYPSIFLMLLSSLCYIIAMSNPISYFILAHLVRACLYLFLFKGIFVRAVIHPYKKLEEILNFLPMAVVTYDNNKTLTFANKQADEIVGGPFKDCYASFSLGQAFTQQPELERLPREIISVKCKNGEAKKVVVEAFRLHSGGCQVVFQEAKRAQGLQRIVLQTQTILDSINNFVLILDRDLRILMCNKKVTDSLEKSLSELTGLYVMELLKVSRFCDEKEALALLSGSVNSDSPLEFTYITEKGKELQLLLQFATIVNLDGETIGAIGIGTDVTELNREKEERQQQEKLALLGKMAAGIVHEIRNPLTVIKGFSSLIRSQENGKIAQYALFIEEEVASLNRIVTDYLAFTKPGELTLKEVSPHSLLDSLKPLLYSHAVEKGIEISYDFDLSNILITADEGKVKQVILNIFQNAVDALNGIENAQIKISTGYEPSQNEFYISIYNNGRIMTEEEKKKIGTPFYTTKPKGTGLGLSICHQIMKDHGGKINVQSSQETGTVFTLAFPIPAGSLFPSRPFGYKIIETNKINKADLI